MDLEMVLNELSLYPLAKDVYGARQRMADLVQTLSEATNHGIKRILRTSVALNDEKLAPDYSVVQWRNDNNVDLELRRLFRSMENKVPYLEDIIAPHILNSFGLSEFFFEEDQAIGLGVAFLLDTLAVSFRSDSCWFDSHVQLKINQLDDDGELTETFEDIPHASHYSHIRENLVWIKARLHSNARAAAHEGLDIWLHKEEWFPRLYFCESVKGRIQTLGRGNPLLMPIVNRLYELDDYCKAWHDGPFDADKMVSKTSPESAETLKKYETEHIFLYHDGIPRIFSWHVRLTPSAWRLFFFPIPEEKKLIVGYLGPKLPSVLYPH